MTTISPRAFSAHQPPRLLHILRAVIALSLLMFAALFLSGCAAVTQTATTSTTQTNGVVSVTTARSSIFAFGDAKTVVDKIRASAGKTSSVGVSGLSEEVSSTNATSGIADIVGAAVRAAVKP
ncbi:MAG: hypothetical protein QM813_09265 [Verrucomicrobiota bacterium]